MSSIQSALSAYASLSVRYSELQKEMRDIQRRRKQLEEQIKAYLKDKDFPGVKVGDKIISLETKNRTTRPKAAELNSELERILQSNGVRDTSKIISELSQLKQKKESQVLKIK